MSRLQYLPTDMLEDTRMLVHDRARDDLIARFFTGPFRLSFIQHNWTEVAPEFDENVPGVSNLINAIDELMFSFEVAVSAGRLDISHLLS